MDVLTSVVFLLYCGMLLPLSSSSFHVYESAPCYCCGEIPRSRGKMYPAVRVRDPSPQPAPGFKDAPRQNRYDNHNQLPHRNLAIGSTLPPRRAS